MKKKPPMPFANVAVGIKITKSKYFPLVPEYVTVLFQFALVHFKTRSYVKKNCDKINV